MLSIGLPLLACSLLVACAKPVSQDDFRHEIMGDARPWTTERFDNAAGNFTFAMVSDLNGGERERIFEIAMAQLSLLRPEFVVSLGDLIDGGSEDRNKLNAEWDSFDARAVTASAPLFYVGGNHDLTNRTMRDLWEQRYGARYYYFAYKNVLYMIFDTEDNNAQRMHEIYVARAAAIKVLQGDEPEKWPETEYYHMPERRFGNLMSEQIAYFKDVLASHPDVRWTFLIMHKPAWQSAADTGFDEIETALGERQYTVFNGHTHHYDYAERNGRDHITLGTTGGSQVPPDETAFDHVTLVTMTDDGPVIGNLRMDGILDKRGHIPLGGDALCYQQSRCDPEAE